MRISIVAMKTWGELGNYLAANKLKRLLESELSNIFVEVIPGETLFPSLAKAGSVIRDIASASISSREKQVRYNGLMSGLQETLFMSAHLEHELVFCKNYLRETSSAVVIGMKGVASRLLCEAIKGSNLRPLPRLINFITNPGLLDIPLHRCTEAEITTFPIPELLWEDAKLPAALQNKVVRVSPLLRVSDSKTDEPTETIWDDESRRTVLILSNHGGAALVKAAEIALGHSSRPNVGLVVLRDADALAQGKLLAIKEVSGRFFISDGMDHAKYFEVARRAARINGSFLLSKTGPNTMLEAVSLGLPVLLHSSWLPMEAWVKPFVERNGIGEVVDLDNMAAAVSQWLDEEAGTEKYAHAARKLGSSLFPDTCHNTVAELIREILWPK